MIAASSAAFNIEAIAYQVLNSFSQACATFTGQNVGAQQFKRTRRVLAICYLEDIIVTFTVIAIVLFFGRSLLTIFVHDPETVEIGFTRLMMVFTGYIFSMAYEMASGYLRGWNLTGSCIADTAWCVRHTHCLGRICVPCAYFIYMDYGCVSDQSRNYGCIGSVLLARVSSFKTVFG